MDCLCKGLYLYITFTQSHWLEEAIPDSYDKCEPGFKAMLHDAIFLATSNAILLVRVVELANTCLNHILLTFSSHIKHSSLINNS